MRIPENPRELIGQAAYPVGDSGIGGQITGVAFYAGTVSIRLSYWYEGEVKEAWLYDYQIELGERDGFGFQTLAEER